MKTENKNCEQLIDSQMQDRNEYLEGLNDIIGDNESDTEKVEEALRELNEFPAGIESYKVIKITLSGGGPADWIEVKVDQVGYVMGMTYHYADWFDHAARKISENSYLWDFAMQIVDTEG
jgi:diaminopimelate decarboxylase